jgi:hypothetical protein
MEIFYGLKMPAVLGMILVRASQLMQMETAILQDISLILQNLVQLH